MDEQQTDPLTLLDRSNTLLDGKLLAHGKPTGALPSMQQRQMNYRLVNGSKYAVEADKIAQGVASE